VSLDGGATVTERRLKRGSYQPVALGVRRQRAKPRLRELGDFFYHLQLLASHKERHTVEDGLEHAVKGTTAQAKDTTTSLMTIFGDSIPPD